MIQLLSLGWNAQLELEHTQDVPLLTPARIVAVDRDSCRVARTLTDLASDTPLRVSLAGRLRGDKPVAVGDWVGVHETRIDHIFTRRSALSRKRVGLSSEAQVIAANVDWTLVTMSLNEDFSPRRLERFVLAAWDAGTTPVVVLTKADLTQDSGAAVSAAAQAAPGCDLFVVSTVTGQGITALQTHLGHGKTSVLIGSSGVGKSSLVNALLGDERMATQSVREGDDKGRHTTTRRELLFLPSTEDPELGSFLIDTPGIREFGVISETDSASSMEHSFSDIVDRASQCSFRDCSHTQEPDCAVQNAIAEGELLPERLASFFKLQRELAYNLRRKNTAQQRSAEKKLWKKRSMEYRARTRHSNKR